MLPNDSPKLTGESAFPVLLENTAGTGNAVNPVLWSLWKKLVASESPLFQANRTKFAFSPGAIPSRVTVPPSKRPSATMEAVGPNVQPAFLASH
jgi:hypothetical protein